MSVYAEWATAVLVLASGVVVLIGALGLHRLSDFFLRMHAPALAATLGAWLVAVASIAYFSVRSPGPTLHVWLVPIVLSIATPVTTTVIARAALFRRRRAGDELPPPLG